MKKFIMVLVLLGSSAYANCSQNDQLYSKGYNSTKEYLQESPNQPFQIVEIFAGTVCQDNCYILAGKNGAKNINMKSCKETCLKGASDAFNNKKQKVECK